MKKIAFFSLLCLSFSAGAATYHADGSITYTKEEVDAFNTQTVKLLILLEKLKDEAEEKPLECI